MAVAPRITIVGAGRLGEALIRGLLDAGAVPKERIRATVGTSKRADLLAERYGLRATAGSNAEAVKESDVIILGVKPGKVASVLAEIEGVLRAEQRVVSMAAAVPLRLLAERVPRDTPLFRAMPNIAMTVGESATALCGNEVSGRHDQRVVGEIFETVGTVEWVDEAAMDAVTGLAGSGPAFVFEMLAGLAAGGQRAGVEKDVAYRLARQTLLGAARLASATELTPQEWIDQVKTPGGTTVAGLAVLDEKASTGGLLEGGRVSDPTRG